MEDLVHCKSINLRSWQGKYVAAEENGAANANDANFRSRWDWDWQVVSKPGTFWILQKNDDCSKSRFRLDSLGSRSYLLSMRLLYLICYNL